MSMRCFVYLFVNKCACVPACVCFCVSMCFRCVCRETACVNRRYSWAGLIVLVIAVVSSLLPGLIAPYALRRTRAENWSAMARGDGVVPPPAGAARALFWPWVRHALHSTFVVVRCWRARARRGADVPHKAVANQIKIILRFRACRVPESRARGSSSTACAQ
jgi:hypothetical protein